MSEIKCFYSGECIFRTPTGNTCNLKSNLIFCKVQREQPKPEPVKEVMPLTKYGEYILSYCERQGWNKDWNIAEKLVNAHSEISEAWDEIANHHAPTEIYREIDKYGKAKPCGFPIEIADTIIRLLHLAAYYQIDIEECIAIKMAYNETRPYRHEKVA